jgi:hypothetical protein
MTTKTDAEQGAGEENPEPSKRSDTLPPPSNGEPAASQPKPLDDMPVAPLTEPADTNGG